MTLRTGNVMDFSTEIELKNQRIQDGQKRRDIVKKISLKLSEEIIYHLSIATRDIDT